MVSKLRKKRILIATYYLSFLSKVGGQFKDASAQNGCRAIHLLLEKTTGCQVPLNIHPSIRPSIHPSIYLSISLSLYRTPQIGGVGGTRALAHSINKNNNMGELIFYILIPSMVETGQNYGSHRQNSTQPRSTWADSPMHALHSSGNEPCGCEK